MLKIFWAAFATAAVLAATPASAHSLLKSSVPANGATVSAPRHLTMSFTQPVRLTALKLTTAGKDLPMKPDRAALAATFSVPVPKLAPGKYLVRWSAMAKDGHAMSGNLAFTIPARRS